MVSILHPNELPWQQRCKVFLQKEKNEWSAASWYERIGTILLVLFAVCMFAVMMGLAFLSVLADPSGSGGM